MPESTADRLAAALAAIPGVPAEMIRLARTGYFDDYRSPLALPLTALLERLGELHQDAATPRTSRPLLAALAERVKSGDFDGTREEARAWAQSPEGQAAYAELLKRRPQP